MDKQNLNSSEFDDLAKEIMNELPQVEGTQQPERMTSAEMGNLWTTYEHDSMTCCVYQHAFKNVKDSQTESILSRALQAFQGNIRSIEEVFKERGVPVPKGFTLEDDLNPQAPPLFSDEFWLYYTHILSAQWLTGYQLGYTTATQNAVLRFYKECIRKAMDLYEQSLLVLQEKGLYRQAPYISIPDGIKFAEKQNFLTGWFGDRRPVNAMEITSLFFNTKKEQLTEALMLGFSQAAKMEESRKFLNRVREVSQKQIEVLSSLLDEEHLSSSGSWEPYVTSSTTPPFSDKLMMFHGQTLINSAVIYYGAGLGTVLRRDIGTHYTRMLAEQLKIGEDGFNIAIRNGWVEKPPQADDREDLMHH